MATVDLSQFSPEYLAADRSQTLINVAILFAVLDTVFVSLYFFSRYKCHVSIGLDGWLMIPGFILCFTHSIVDILLVKLGHAGHHVVTANMDQITAWLKLELAEEFIYFPSLSFPKLAILCLYLRIFTTKFYRYTTYATAGVIILSNIVFIIVTGTDCTPFAYNWDKTIADGHCVNLLAVYRWVSIPNIGTDLVMIILPLPVIWRLHAGRAQKIGLTITFLTGCIGVIGAIIRFVYFFDYDVFSDITWYCVDMMTWTTAEPGIYLIAACLPSLRPLFRLYFKDVDFSSVGTRLLGSRSKASAPGSDDKDVQLSGVNGDSAVPSGRRSAFGFVKLNGSVRLSPRDDHQRLVTCSAQDVAGPDGSNGAHTDLEKGAIHVRKDVSLQSYPK